MLEGLSPEMARALQSPDSTPMISAGIEVPRLVLADAAELRDQMEVIGVVIQGRPRAYPLEKLSGLLDHVVNDQVVGPTGDVHPFTVTYCNATECIRVLESTENLPINSLELGTMGMLEGELFLFRGDQRFKQTEVVEGLQDLPFERTTWGEWRAEHPETEVFVGRSRTQDTTTSDTLR